MAVSCLTEVEKDKVVKDYLQLNSAAKVANIFSVSKKTILNVLNERNIKRVRFKDLKNRNFDESQKEHMCKLYREGKTVTSLCEKFNASFLTVRNILTDNNIEIRGSFIKDRKLNYAQEFKVVDKYKTETIEEIAAYFSVGETAITDILKRHNIKRRRGGHILERTIPKSVQGDIILDYENGLSLSKLEKKYSIANEPIRKFLHKKSVTMRPAKLVLESLTHRKCSYCKNVKPITYFHASVSEKRTLDYDYVCKRCRINNRYLHVYNISLDDYLKRLGKQHGLCSICSQPEKRTHQNGKVKNLAIDHDHITNKVRGLLCADCNTGIGYLKEDIDVMMKAIDYLHHTALIENRPLFRYKKTDKEYFCNREIGGDLCKYKLTKHQYGYLYSLQNGSCKICGAAEKDKKLNIDHDHTLEGPLSVRGLLCHSCNSGLSKFVDDPCIINFGVCYLQKFKHKENQKCL